jgi:hypothetical protein
MAENGGGLQRPSRRPRRALMWSLAAALGLAVIISALAATAPDQHNFSQFPGFAEYFAEHPPSTSVPDAAEQALLRRHRPRFYLPDGHAGLIGFYEDYVAQGVLRDGAGEIIAEPVDPATLNAHRHDPTVVLEHRQQDNPQSPIVLARIDHDDIEIGEASVTMTFLTYHAVFRHSGLVAGLAWWQELAVGLAGDLDDWHQLDHYTAATLVLDAAQRPVALMLQQHNYQRTYLLGEGYRLPTDGRPEIDIAIRSNELYVHRAGRRLHRSVRFPDAQSLSYLLGGGEGSMLAAHDITDPAEEASYDLGFLPPDDAFYTFKGFLGERRRLPGRDSPPGADYNTLPQYKPWTRQLMSGYWRPGNSDDIARLDAARDGENWAAVFLARQTEVFAVNFECVSRQTQICQLQPN